MPDPAAGLHAGTQGSLDLRGAVVATQKRHDPVNGYDSGMYQLRWSIGT
jgi:hypothetical protein